MRRSRRGSDERGQATIEMIGIIPIAVLVAGAIIQLFMIGYAAVAAESSARLAAREYSQGSTDAGTAEADARRDAPGIFDAQVQVADGNLSSGGNEPSVSGDPVPDSVSAKAVYTVPFIGIGIKGLDLKVTRYVVLPRTN